MQNQRSSSYSPRINMQLPFTSQRYSQQDQSIADVDIQNGQPQFETQNFLYQLQSKCNNLEYQKTKNAMLHQNQINQLNSRNAYLQEWAAGLAQQNQALAEEKELLRNLLNQVREDNFNISKQISQMKHSMTSLIDQKGAYADDTDSLQVQEQLFKKEETITALKHELQRMSYFQVENRKLSSEIDSRRQQCVALSHQLKTHQQEQSQLKSRLESQRAQFEIKLLNQNINSAQICKLTELIQCKDEQLKKQQNDRVCLQSKVNQLTLQNGRLKCQKKNLQQYNQYLQTNSQEIEGKKKLLQEETFRNQKEISDMRTQIFNQKLEHKKQLNHLKLQFEEQRIKYLQSLEEKSKEVHKLREKNSQTSRQVIDIEELSMKNQGIMTDLDRANNKISQLKMENDCLRDQIRVKEQKLQKKHQKICALQSKNKAERDERIKALETQIYSLQEINNELELKLELTKGKSSSQAQSQSQSQLAAHLKAELQQKNQKISEMELREGEFSAKKEGLADQLIKAEGQLRLYRQLRTVSPSQDTISALQLLQKQVQAVNLELDEERRTQQQKRREQDILEQQYRQEIRGVEQEREVLVSKCNRFSQRVSQLQQKLGQKEEELQKLTQELQNGGQNSNIRQVRQPKSQSESINGQQLVQRIMQLQKENIELKVDYSQALQEINSLLVKYQSLEEKQQAQEKAKQTQVDAQMQVINTRVTQLQQQCERLRSIIGLQEQQEQQLVRTINEMKVRRSAGNQISQSKVNDIVKYQSDQLWLHPGQKGEQVRQNQGRGYQHYRI